MARYKILVVDDEETRNPIYESLFRVSDPSSNYFELEFANNSYAEFLEKNSATTYHCYIVDISLNGPGWSNSSDKTFNVFSLVLEEIGNKRPIVLISAKWGNVIEWLNNFLEYNIVSVIDFMAVGDGTASDNMVYNSILTILKKTYKFSDFDKPASEQINILHISDLQFCEINDDNPDSTKKKTLVDELLLDIPNYLSCNLINIDFIAITGDITENALPSEFEYAERWLKDFCEKILGKYDSERVFLVNRNHDYNLSLNSLNHFKFEYGSSPLKMEKLAKHIEDYSQISFLPYKSFLTKMTNENLDSLTYYNYKFQHLGIRFLILNTLETYNVKISSNRNDMFNINDLTFQNIIDRERKSTDNDLFTIILSHASPNNLGYLNLTDKKYFWKKIENSVSRFKNSLLLSGHQHEESYLTPIPVKNGGKLIHIQAKTLLAVPSESGISRGFSVVTLDRKDKKITKITNQIYSINSSMGIDKSTIRFEPIDD